MINSRILLLKLLFLFNYKRRHNTTWKSWWECIYAHRGVILYIYLTKDDIIRPERAKHDENVYMPAKGSLCAVSQRSLSGPANKLSKKVVMFIWKQKEDMSILEFDLFQVTLHAKMAMHFHFVHWWFLNDISYLMRVYLDRAKGKVYPSRNPKQVRFLKINWILRSRVQY